MFRSNSDHDIYQLDLDKQRSLGADLRGQKVWESVLYVNRAQLELVSAVFCQPPSAFKILLSLQIPLSCASVMQFLTKYVVIKSKGTEVIDYMHKRKQNLIHISKEMDAVIRSAGNRVVQNKTEAE